MSSTSHLQQQPNLDALRQLLYTPLEEAIHLLDSRKKQALALPDFDIPEPLRRHSQSTHKQHPHTAILFRQIATPNHEMRRAIQLCDDYNLNLLVLTIKKDKFSTRNACKYALGRMGFFEGFGRQGGKKIRYRTIINFNHYDGRLLQECKTLRGQSLMEYHHDLLLQELPQLNPDNLVDCSEWFLTQREKTGNWYRALLKLFLQHAIFFETFVLSGKELDFTLTNVLPAFQEIYDTFGIKPLIVHSEAPEQEGDEYWQLYPEHLRALAPYERRKSLR